MKIMRIFSIILALYLLMILFSWMFQDRLIFQPRRRVGRTPASVGLAYEEVFLRTADDVTISSWFIPCRGAGETLLFFHGNAGNLSNRIESVVIFNRLGLNVFIIDYRGYGRSGGSPSEKGVYLDADAAWRYLTETRGVLPERIIVFGRSLGGVIAARSAERYRPLALILESTFSSAADVGRSFLPFVPLKMFMGGKFDITEVLAQITCPVMVIHSPQDEIVPYRLGRRLFQRLRAPKTFLEISGDHNGGFLLSGELYVAGIGTFLDYVRSR